MIISPTPIRYLILTSRTLSLVLPNLHLFYLNFFHSSFPFPLIHIDICYSDIGRKYVGLKTVIPISEEFRYRHPSPFRYPSIEFEPKTLVFTGERLTSQPLCYHKNIWISDIRLKFISDIGIMSDSALFSPISEVPISSSVRYR
jgi:hypothetical protein